MPMMLLGLANMMMFNTFIRSMQMHHLSTMTFRHMPDVAVITRDRSNYPFS
jgi:predicted ATP-grasp superfamily ATP-dependent carboligase